MTRAERKALNKRAHAIRRELTNADYRQAKDRGDGIAWRDIAAVYDAIPAVDVIAMADELARDTAPSAPAVKRSAPAHIVRASQSYALALAAWENGLADALRGGRTRANGGRPARGESYPDEERDYREAHPKPSWLDHVRAESAANLHGASS
jgi:hypothetical protein